MAAVHARNGAAGAARRSCGARSLVLTGVLGLMLSAPALSQDAPPAPVRLRCEYLVDPLGIDEEWPRFSWELRDPRPGALQTAYHVLVADSAERLAQDEGTLWDSGKVLSADTAHVCYAGQPLCSRARAWWKVRVFDQDGAPSPWSASARFTLGLLEESDWHAQWIGDAAEPPPHSAANNGFHSELADAPDAAKWVVLDLGETREIDAFRLFPARPYNWTSDAPGFLFPVSFRIEVAEQPDFAGAVAAAEASEVENPGTAPLELAISPVRGRYVRLAVTRLAERGAGEYGFALAEMQVLCGGDDVARGATVTASDSVEDHGWSARALADGDIESHGPRGLEPQPPLMLRKSFLLPPGARVARATAYATALGLCELRVNGARAGENELAPEWTDYHRRVQYQTYDVTRLLRPGENVLAALLGDGWYAGKIGLTGIVPGGPPRGIYGRQPRLFAQIEIDFEDGGGVTILSDGTWKATAEGPLRAADLLDGVTVDLRRAMPGFDAPGFDDSSWRPAVVRPPPAARLVAQMNEPIRVTREIAPVALAEPAPGVFVFDLGQNLPGWCRLTVTGADGDVITLRHAEVRNADGTIYTENLRGAAQTDRFILAGGGPEVLEPRFTYHGFRFVEVTGLRAPPGLSKLAGRVAHSAPQETAEFACSNPLLEQLWRNILWTQRANMYSVPTDCPQRDERLGWSGDILAFAQTACFNMDMAAFLAKWLEDMQDAQTEDGRYPDFAPHPYDPAVRFSGVPAWGDAGVHVAWCHYLNYGDSRLLARHFDSARRWVDWIEKGNPDLLWKNARGNDYGDWLNADTLQLEGWPRAGAEAPKELFATAFFARSAEIVSWMAGALERRVEEAHYAALAAGVRAAFQQAYLAPDGALQGDTQAGYAIALAFDLLPEEARPAAAERMVAGFARYHGQISTGFHSTICLMNELARNGKAGEAYRLIESRTLPSWGYAIDQGATTIWERWDGYVADRGFQDPGMNSFAHYALGSVGEWMMRTIIGISPDPAAPGFRRFFLRPIPGGTLTWARGAHHSIRGRIACAWRIEDERMIIDAEVPPNTSATLVLPTAGPEAIRELPAGRHRVSVELKRPKTE
ncbi:MAG: glycoside hydrolase family 78 protein [Planctomycetes bacterium]|nr:glycoside hydrolase family 78 protein [Planctomycetota bacterium]